MHVQITAGTLMKCLEAATAPDGIINLQLAFEGDTLITGGVSIDNSRFSHIESDRVEVIEPGVWNIVLLSEVTSKLKNFGPNDLLDITNKNGKVKVQRKSPSKYYIFDDASPQDIICRRIFVPEITDDLKLILHRIKDGATITAAQLSVELRPNLKEFKSIFKSGDVFQQSVEIIFDNAVLEIYTEQNSLGSGDAVTCEEIYTAPDTPVHSFYQGLKPIASALKGKVVLYFGHENLIYIEDVQEDMTAYYLVMQKSDLS